MKIMVSLSGFDAWFKKSKVLDSHNKPLVCYHGTNKVFSKFSEYRPSFVTPNKAYAKQYGKILMSLYVSIQKPFDTRSDTHAVRIYNEHFTKFDLARADVKPVKLGEPVHMNHADELWAFLIENPQFGYDGMYVWESSVSSIHDSLATADISIVPLHPWQLKAIDNKICSKDLDIHK